MGCNETTMKGKIMNSIVEDAKFFGYVTLTVAASTVRMKKTAKKFGAKAGLITPQK